MPVYIRNRDKYNIINSIVSVYTELLQFQHRAFNLYTKLSLKPELNDISVVYIDIARTYSDDFIRILNNQICSLPIKLQELINMHLRQHALLLDSVPAPTNDFFFDQVLYLTLSKKQNVFHLSQKLNADSMHKLYTTLEQVLSNNEYIHNQKFITNQIHIQLQNTRINLHTDEYIILKMINNINHNVQNLVLHLKQISSKNLAPTSITNKKMHEDINKLKTSFNIKKNINNKVDNENSTLLKINLHFNACFIQLEQLVNLKEFVNKHTNYKLIIKHNSIFIASNYGIILAKITKYNIPKCKIILSINHKIQLTTSEYKKANKFLMEVAKNISKTTYYKNILILAQEPEKIKDLIQKSISFELLNIRVKHKEKLFNNLSNEYIEKSIKIVKPTNLIQQIQNILDLGFTPTLQESHLKYIHNCNIISKVHNYSFTINLKNLFIIESQIRYLIEHNIPFKASRFNLYRIKKQNLQQLHTIYYQTYKNDPCNLASIQLIFDLNGIPTTSNINKSSQVLLLTSIRNQTFDEQIEFCLRHNLYFRIKQPFFGKRNQHNNFKLMHINYKDPQTNIDYCNKLHKIGYLISHSVEAKNDIINFGIKNSYALQIRFNGTFLHLKNIIENGYCPIISNKNKNTLLNEIRDPNYDIRNLNIRFDNLLLHSYNYILQNIKLIKSLNTELEQHNIIKYHLNEKTMLYNEANLVHALPDSIQKYASHNTNEIFYSLLPDEHSTVNTYSTKKLSTEKIIMKYHTKLTIYNNNFKHIRRPITNYHRQSKISISANILNISNIKQDKKSKLNSIDLS